MSIRLSVIVGLAGALMCALPATAEVHALAVSGNWTVFSGTDPDNKAVCGMRTEGAETRRIAIVQYAGDTGTVLRLRKDSWTIPADIAIGIQVQYDGGPQVPVKGMGSGQEMWVNLPLDQTLPFMVSFGAAMQIRVLFQEGNEPPWTSSLNGSAKALDTFDVCRKGLNPAAATQPFSPAAMPAPDQTQPSGAPPLVQGRP
jgi:hypothetical protein